jgi:glycosyltransferase involved in cell wall biosynthesis
MKLAVLSSWYPAPPTNGAKLRAWHLLAELAARHDVTLLTFAEPGEAEAPESADLRAMCRDVRVVPGNPHKPSAPLSWGAYFARMPRSYAQTFSPAMAAQVAAVSPGVDAIVAFEVGTALYLDARSQPPGIFEEAEISTIRDDVGRATSQVDRWRRTLTWRKYAAFTSRLVAATSRTTVVSEQERACLEQAGCDAAKLAVVPNGVPAAYLNVETAPRPDTLIYSGSVTYAPNLDAVTSMVSDILPRVRASRPDVAFTVTGNHGGVPIDHLRGPGVTFAGFVPDIVTTVASTAVCVVPLRRGGGTRLKILEAMALGTPVVSTRKGAEGLEVVDGEHLLIADEPEAFARAVLELLDRPDRARTIAANARALVADRYTWPRIGRTLEQIIEAAVDTGRAHRRSA